MLIKIVLAFSVAVVSVSLSVWLLYVGPRLSTRVADEMGSARAVALKHGLPIRNTFVFPVFQLDRRRRTIRPAAARINQMLGAVADPWGVVSWWVGPNERVGGKTPVALLEAGDLETLERLAELEAAPLDP